jgi:phage shock protein A
METTELKIDTVSIHDIEILRVGKWNGIDVKETDLKEMVSNFEGGVIEPYLNLDHNDKYTDNVKKALSVVSLGFVSQLKQVGDRLIANFKQVPIKIAELIKSGMLKKRSVEFYPRGFNQNGKTFNNVLKAVSFFGADVPAVNALSDDFEILLKQSDNTTTLNTEIECTKINFIQEKNMDITIAKSEYDELLKFKNDAVRITSEVEAKEDTIQHLKAEVEKITAEKKDVEKKVSDAEAFMKKYETEKQAALEKEAVNFVDGLIKELKLLPKFKEDKVADYIAKSADAVKLESFKEELLSRGKVINLGELKDEAGNLIVGKIETSEQAQNAVEAKMKAGMSYEDAVKAVTGMEV